MVFAAQEDAAQFAASGLQVESHEGNRVRIAIQGDYAAFTQELARYAVRSIDISTQNLEDIFMNYYDRDREVNAE
ncbi:hypothetical protein D3C87_2019430 [compost metagenome]